MDRPGCTMVFHEPLNRYRPAYRPPPPRGVVGVAHARSHWVYLRFSVASHLLDLRPSTWI